MRQVCTILAMVTKRRELILLAIVALVPMLGGCVAPPPVPYAPSSLTAIAVSPQQIDLSWKDNARVENGFYVYRRTTGSYRPIAALDPNTTSYSDSSLSPGTTYWYKVAAYNDGGKSDPSNEISATTPSEPLPPLAPSDLSSTAVSSTQIDLSWKDNAVTEKGFYVYRKTNGDYERVKTLGPNATSWTDISLSPQTRYSYWVTGYNERGESAASNEIHVTTPLPEWYSLLRPELRPTGDGMNKLETIRATHEVPQEVFALGISSYPSASRLLQINLYKQAREQWPDMSEKDLLKSVFGGRALAPEPYGYGMTPDEFATVMKGINSLEELCDYVAFKDSKEPEYELDLTEWEKYVDMLKEAGIGADIDWERHKNNVRRMKEDNVKEKINVILEDEVEKALSETKVRVSRKEFAEALYLWLSMSLTEEAVRQAAEGFDFEIKNDEDLSRMFEGLFLLNMWLTVYTCEREFEDEEKRNECLDMFHTLVYESYVDWDVMDFVEWMNSIGVLYIEYDSAMNIHHPSGPLWVVAKTFNRNLFGEVEEDVFVQMGIVVHIGTFIEHLGEAIRQYDVE